ncbi:MAG: DUF883 C-terminal domain-containing protein [Bdellovibrionales bacterium]|nr:DUF883 C-terminal domain-containing protein [Bdellovibrionales bacterium]
MSESKDFIGQIPGMKKEDLDSLELRLKEAKEITSDFVRKYPLTSVALAAGVGYLIAKFFSQKR